MVRTRRIAAVVLAVLTAIFLLATSLGWWADRYFLDSDRFAGTANRIIEQGDVQTALSVAITDEISNASGADLRVAQPFIDSIVTGVVRSDQFQNLFDAAVLRLHRAIVGGEARRAVLNLSSVVDRVRNAIEPIAPNLADRIPEGEQVRITVLDRTQLDTVYETVNRVENLVVLFTVLTVVCFVAAIVVSLRRWRTLALTGWVTLGLFLVALLAQRVGRGVVGGYADRAEYRNAAQAAYKVIVRGLVVQTVVIAVLGLVVALFAGWTDRHGGWAGVTTAWRRGVAWTKQQVPTRTPSPAPALAAAGPGAVVAAGPLDATGAPPVATEVGEDAGPAGSGTRVVVEGVLAPRLPEPRSAPRAAHWWRAAGLLALGLFAVFSPGSLTTLVVVLLGLAALYLALTEAVAAWGAPKPLRPSEPETIADAAEPEPQAEPETIADAAEPEPQAGAEAEAEAQSGADASPAEESPSTDA